MIGFIALFDIERDYNLYFTITQTHILVSTVTSSLTVARQRLPKEDVPLLLGS
jgi:hypothetical protein